MEVFIDNKVQNDVAQLIEAYQLGHTDAYDAITELMYGELRKVSHRARLRMGGNPTLRTTAVVSVGTEAGRVNGLLSSGRFRLTHQG